MPAVFRVPTSRPMRELLQAPWRPDWFAIGVAAGVLALSALCWWAFVAGSSAAYHAIHITLEKLFHAY